MNESGFVLIDKPEGITSSDLVLKIKRLKKLKKIGHTGTLDKFACGLMILPFGDFTAFSSHFLGKDKVYEAFFEFGKSTDSGDRDGEITDLWEPEKVNNFFQENEPFIREKITNIESWTSQNAPFISALKVKGKRQAELFRKKIEMEPKVRKVEISQLEILELTKKGVRISVQVSSGTYIRKIAMDLAEEIGLPMFVSFLRRTKIGIWKLESAIHLDNLLNSDSPFFGIEMVDIKRVPVSMEDAKVIRYGKYIPIQNDLPMEFLFFHEDSLVAWCEKKTEDTYLYKKVFMGM